MIRTFCDYCGECLDQLHTNATLPAPFIHPEYGSSFSMRFDLCCWCAGCMLAAYGNEDYDEIMRCWMKVADRQGWEIPWKQIVELAFAKPTKQPEPLVPIKRRRSQ